MMMKHACRTAALILALAIGLTMLSRFPPERKRFRIAIR